MHKRKKRRIEREAVNHQFFFPFFLSLFFRNADMRSIQSPHPLLFDFQLQINFTGTAPTAVAATVLSRLCLATVALHRQPPTRTITTMERSTTMVTFSPATTTASTTTMVRRNNCPSQTPSADLECQTFNHFYLICWHAIKFKHIFLPTFAKL